MISPYHSCSALEIRSFTVEQLLISSVLPHHISSIYHRPLHSSMYFQNQELWVFYLWAATLPYSASPYLICWALLRIESLWADFLFMIRMLSRNGWSYSTQRSPMEGKCRLEYCILQLEWGSVQEYIEFGRHSKSWELYYRLIAVGSLSQTLYYRQSPEIWHLLCVYTHIDELIEVSPSDLVQSIRG